MAELIITTEPTGPDAPEPVVQQQQAPVAAPDDQQQQQPAQPAPAVDSQQQTSATDSTAPEKPAEPTSDEAVSKFVQDAGFDPIELSKQIAQSGDIASEAKTALGAKLEKAGLPVSMIDEYITGQKAVMDMTVRDIMSVAGGEEGYQEMADWASKNLSEAELKAYSDIMTKADVNTAKLTVGNMYARFKSNVPSAGKLVRGSTAASGGDIFRSWEQQKDAQRDPRYKADPAFRKEVEQKIERTLLAGGYR